MKSILLSILNISLFSKADFIWMIHPLNLDDVFKRYKFLKILPKNFVYFLLKLIPPLVLSEVRNIKSFDGKKKRGYILGCFITTELMHNNKELVRSKVIKAAKITKKLNSKILVIGGTISVDKVTEEYIKNNIGIVISNGAATMTMIIEKRINDIIIKNNLMYSKLKLAIVNAASSKGFLVSKIFSKYNFDEVLLFDNNEEKLENLKKLIKNKITISTNIEDLKKFDLIIIAPSYKKVNFNDSYFKNGVIIYDVDDPHYDFGNITKNISVYNNGLLDIGDISYGYNLGIPSNTAYTCLVEAFLLAMSGDLDDKYYNNVTTEQVDRIKKYFNKSKINLVE